MEPFSIWLKFYTKTNLSAGKSIKLVPMAGFKGKSPRGARYKKMEPFLIWLKFCSKTNLSAGNPLEIHFQGKSPFFAIVKNASLQNSSAKMSILPSLLLLADLGRPSPINGCNGESTCASCVTLFNISTTLITNPTVVNCIP